MSFQELCAVFVDCSPVCPYAVAWPNDTLRHWYCICKFYDEDNYDNDVKDELTYMHHPTSTLTDSAIKIQQWWDLDCFCFHCVCVWVCVCVCVCVCETVSVCDCKCESFVWSFKSIFGCSQFYKEKKLNDIVIGLLKHIYANTYE